MTTYFSSDTHFGHKNILTHCPGRLDYCSNIKEMDELIIERWNKKVEPEDIVWHLGDVFFCGNTYGRSILERLNGRKRLVIGNHDYSRSFSKWEKLGFECVMDSAQIRLDGKTCWLSHYPYRESNFLKSFFKRYYHKERYTERRLRDHGDFLLCGHVHDTWKTKGNAINVGIDCWDMAPVSDTELIKLMRKMNKSI